MNLLSPRFQISTQFLLPCLACLLVAGCIQPGMDYHSTTTATTETLDHFGTTTESDDADTAKIVKPPLPAADPARAVERLADRLRALTLEVNDSPQRRGFGVLRDAFYQADSDEHVHRVVFSVNVSWCSDDCVDGPADTPAKDEDLTLLLPFANSLTHLDLQKTEITDQGLKILSELTNLKSLNLANTQINGSGLAHLKALKHLEDLNLSATSIEAERNPCEPHTLDSLKRCSNRKSPSFWDSAL
jgi:hypothetical protein